MNIRKLTTPNGHRPTSSQTDPRRRPVLFGSWRSVSRWELGIVWVLVALTSACAAKTTPPPLPATLKYSEFVYPAVPPPLRASPAADAIERGWRFLQNDDLGNAQKEFERALKESRTFYPARAGAGRRAPWPRS